jgi:hypothetical protein
MKMMNINKKENIKDKGKVELPLKNLLIKKLTIINKEHFTEINTVIIKDLTFK